MGGYTRPDPRSDQFPRLPGELFILRSKKGTFDLIPLPFRPGSRTESGDRETWLTSQVLDATGDGLPDFVQVVDGEMHLYLHEGGKPDLLTAMVDGFGSSHRFTYRPLSDSSVYQPGPDCSHPQQPLRRAMWVVSSHEEDTGLRLPQVVTYSYRDGRKDVAGRGNLGFGTIIATDQSTGATTTTTYDHNTRVSGRYPFAGLPETIVVDTPLAPDVINRRATVVTRKVHWSSNRTWFTHPVRFQYSELEGRQEALTLLRSEDGEEQVDLHGNVTLLTRRAARIRNGTPIGFMYRQDIRSWYANFEASWLIGLLIERKNTSTTRDGNSVTRTTRHRYSSETGLHIGSVYEPQLDSSGMTQASLSVQFLRDKHGLIRRVDRESEGTVRQDQYFYLEPDLVDLASVTNAAGHHCHFSWDPVIDRPVGVQDINGNETAISYDGFGRIRQQIHTDGSQVDMGYTIGANGEPVFQISETGGRHLELHLDPGGRETSRTWEALNGEIITVNTRYDDQGRIWNQTGPYATGAPIGLSTDFYYDALGRLTGVSHPDGATERHEYNGLSERQWDGNNNLSEISYDELGRVELQTAGFGEPSETQVAFEYGPFGNLTAISSPNGRRFEYTYDVWGRRTKVEHSDFGRQEIKYNGFGDLVEEIGPTGLRTNYTVDSLGRVLSITTEDGTYAFEWDSEPHGIGLIAATMSPDGVRTVHRYNARSLPKQVEWIITGSSYAYEYDYDGLGRISSITYPAARATGLRGRRRAKILRAYASQGDLVAVRDSNSGTVLWELLRTDAFGRPTSERFGNGMLTTRSYDKRGRIKRIQTETASGNIIQYLSYGYYPNGSVEWASDDRTDSGARYNFDRFNRLTRWEIINTSSGQTESLVEYEYSPSGNLIARRVIKGQEISQVYVYGENGAPRDAVTSTAASTGAGPALSYQYDELGRQVLGPNRSVAFNSLNLPSSIDMPSGRRTFKYDAFGRKVLQQDSDGSRTVTAGALFEAQYGRRGRLRAAYGLVEGELTIAQLRTDSTRGPRSTVYFHRDRLGTPETSTDSAGSMVRQRYDPFGRWLSGRGAPANWGPLRGFTGHRMEDSFGLIDMRGRLYDPVAARFITPDPFLNPITDGQAHNLYAYVRNNPITLRDPSGYQSLDQSAVSEGGGNHSFPALLTIVHGPRPAPSHTPAPQPTIAPSPAPSPPSWGDFRGGGSGFLPPQSDRPPADDAPRPAPPRNQAPAGLQGAPNTGALSRPYPDPPPYPYNAPNQTPAKDERFNPGVLSLAMSAAAMITTGPEASVEFSFDRQGDWALGFSLGWRIGPSIVLSKGPEFTWFPAAKSVDEVSGGPYVTFAVEGGEVTVWGLHATVEFADESEVAPHRPYPVLGAGGSVAGGIGLGASLAVGYGWTLVSSKGLRAALKAAVEWTAQPSVISYPASPASQARWGGRY